MRYYYFAKAPPNAESISYIDNHKHQKFHKNEPRNLLTQKFEMNGLHTKYALHIGNNDSMVDNPALSHGHRTAVSTPQTLWHCSSAESAIRRQSPAVRTATPAFNVRSSGLFCCRPGGLKLITRLSSGSDTFFWRLSFWSENFSFLVCTAH